MDKSAKKWDGPFDLKVPDSADAGRRVNFFLRENKPLIVGTAGALISGGMLLNKMHSRLQNDMQRKSLIEDLHLNDPILKQVDKSQLIEWYATIMHFAPKFSLDKPAVREVLNSFAQYGRVDLNTLKMLAEVESSVAKASSGSMSWGTMLTGIAQGVGNALS